MNQYQAKSESASPDFLTLTCPSCGSKLKLASQVHILVCAHCGNEHMVHRDGGAVYLAPLVQDVKQIRVGVDKTAAELAVARLTKEIAVLDNQIEEANRRNYSPQVPPIKYEGWMIFAAISSFFGAFAFMMLATALSSWVIGVLSPVSLFVLVWMMIAIPSSNREREREIVRIKQMELDRLANIRAAKIAALQKNHQIANS